MKLFLVDTSAWYTSEHRDIATTWAVLSGEDLLATCPQARLEILCSARNTEGYEQLTAELGALRQLPCGEREFERALEVQHALARRGGLRHRSVTIADLIIAAAAEAGDAVVWHYDEDFDRIAEITGQPTRWVAPRGSL